MKISSEPQAGGRRADEAAAASELALRALAFISLDEDRLARFIALTGLDASDVRALLGDRHFHLAVLDHLAGDEATLLEFAITESAPPESVGRARRALGGGED
ncbi:DUF3572 family protein [Methylocystis parvus]|uniref:DUF3572 family protein n=1 Tax=Methylocystis parvus TaxID=134 RepID=A0A6B8M090_9HYPH|nr:DUF3572 family protein [Methylocystis parvus]QGM96241.1 DUF3572 family protein [Methylocystis parvus]WBJ99928.1 DUF3572 domain-containing protein [Methylocystis parvus OBBP]